MESTKSKSKGNKLRRGLHFPITSASYIDISEERTWLIVGAVRHLKSITFGSCLVRLNLLHVLKYQEFSQV